jgi:aminopeptidase N
MATYVSTATVGRFTLATSTLSSGVVMTAAVQPDQLDASRDALAKIGPILDFYGRYFGPYPFRDTGVIIDDVEVGYQMETQTRPLLPGPPKDGVLEHELAHQWFGNAVTPRLWKDVWLNEGFASYAAMMWSEEHGDGDLDEFYDDWMTRFPHHPMWKLTMGDLGAADMLNIYMYSRGLLFLHALRRTVGDNAFFATLRAWTHDDKYKNATTQDFQALAERTSGKDLDALVRAWVYTPSQPPYTPKPSR